MIALDDRSKPKSWMAPAWQNGAGIEALLGQMAGMGPGAPFDPVGLTPPSIGASSRRNSKSDKVGSGVVRFAVTPAVNKLANDFVKRLDKVHK